MMQKIIPTCNVTVTQNPVYNISLSTSPSGLYPQPTGEGKYFSGQNATITAQPVSGYIFQNWTENESQVYMNPAYQFTVTGDRNLVAEYTQNTVSPVGWWKFDNDILDWSGNGNNGICSGSGCPTPTSGKIAGALYFDGIDDYINAGNGTSLNITGSITIEAWIRPSKLATSYIAKKASQSSTDGYELSLSSTGKAFFRVNQKTSSNSYRVDTIDSYPITNTTWVHLVGIYNGSHLQIYLNGTLQNSVLGPSNILSNTDNLEIGGPDGSAYFKGGIDEVRIWNRALTPQEIEASYKAVPPYLNSINVTPDTINLVAGETQNFISSPKDQYGDTISVSVAWSSSNETVGTVNPITGDFNALVAGTTMVNATNGSVTGTAVVTVKTKTLTPSITVVSPNGSENWVIGTTQTIIWNYTGNPGKYVKIELLKPGVANKVIIARTLNDGSHPWLIPNTQAPGTDYKIRVSSTINSAYNNTSNNNFTIS
jgi:hypothetical protein